MKKLGPGDVLEPRDPWIPHRPRNSKDPKDLMDSLTHQGPRDSMDPRDPRNSSAPDPNDSRHHKKSTNTREFMDPGIRASS